MNALGRENVLYFGGLGKEGLVGAYAEYRFEKGFLLDEERLRRINSILTAFGKGHEGVEFRYAVKRNDAFRFKTADIEEILAEDNSRSQRIEAISVETVSGELRPREVEFRLALDFESKWDRGSRLIVEGEDRNSVFVLFSDLKEYTKNEICLASSAPYRALASTVGAVFLAMLLYMLWVSFRLAAPKPADMLRALQSSDFREKLDFVIQQNRFLSEPTVLVVGITLPAVCGALCFSAAWLLRRLLKYLYPKNLFLIGKERDRYERIKSTRAKLWWGVIVSLLVSVIGGIIAWALTGTR